MILLCFFVSPKRKLSKFYIFFLFQDFVETNWFQELTEHFSSTPKIRWSLLRFDQKNIRSLPLITEKKYTR